MRPQDVGLSGADSRQAGINILPGLLQLGPHVAVADDLAFTINRCLTPDNDVPLAITRRNDDRRRRFAARRSDDYRLGLIFNKFPGLIGLFDLLGRFLTPLIPEGILAMSEIKFAVDY